MMAERKLPVGRILTGDCIELMKGFPDASVDLLLPIHHNLQLGGELSAQQHRGRRSRRSVGLAWRVRGL